MGIGKLIEALSGLHTIKVPQACRVYVWGCQKVCVGRDVRGIFGGGAQIK